MSNSPSTAPREEPSPAIPSSLRVVKRDGRNVPFEPARIRTALERAFRAVQSIAPDQPLPGDLARQIQSLTDTVCTWCRRRELVEVEQIQDEVERALMRSGEHVVARRYILYREQRAQARRTRDLSYEKEDGTLAGIPHERLRELIEAACQGLDPDVEPERIYERSVEGFYDEMPEHEMEQALVLAARSLIEEEPDYTYASARLLLQSMYKEVFDADVPLAEAGTAYRDYFARYIERGQEAGILDPELQRFDLDRLAQALRPGRDLNHTYLSVQTLYDRYLLKEKEDRRFELPQLMWMRVAMGLALNEDDPEERAIAFYNLLSSFHFVNSTPTLFNAGTQHAQLSSCYLTTVQDDLGHIFKSYRDNALLSKWAGGLGNDWTNIRALGAHIKGTGGTSQGIVPFLKVANDTTVAVNQGGRRKGAACAYLETWHLDVEEFLELRRNTGDERRRTHDMNTASWVPDLFMKRVRAKGEWTLFSPDEVPDLHHCYGAAFEERYRRYEEQADRGEIDNFKRVKAVKLWRKMLSMLFETGHPWITFKDPSNVRSPQDHAGVVHSSNLCTEILLNTSKDETAVCNLGSVNLVKHLDEEGQLDRERLEETVTTAVRMLDNVIDINFYPTPEAENANQRHRPVGLGVMGFQDTLHRRGSSYASEEAVAFADRSMEAVSYYALQASALLAEERGAYRSFDGSKWDRGLLPVDTIDLLEKERGEPVEVPRARSMDWTPVRRLIAEHGMRNSNVLAIAPTATISNIAGVSQSIEPAYKHLFVKSNLSGEFTQVNPHLVAALKEKGLWDEEMIDDLKYFDGTLEEIDRVPDSIKERYPTAFEIAPKWLIECAARRQKWIDMGQSLNLYVSQPSGRRISKMYQRAWRKGLKTTYYLRSQAATQVEKSTVDINRRSIQPRWMKSESASSGISVQRGEACTITEPECEVCQ